MDSLRSTSNRPQAPGRGGRGGAPDSLRSKRTRSLRPVPLWRACQNNDDGRSSPRTSPSSAALTCAVHQPYTFSGGLGGHTLHRPLPMRRRDFDGRACRALLLSGVNGFVEEASVDRRTCLWRLGLVNEPQPDAEPVQGGQSPTGRCIRVDCKLTHSRRAPGGQELRRVAAGKQMCGEVKR
jgi:hypothetical protein